MGLTWKLCCGGSKHLHCVVLCLETSLHQANHNSKNQKWTTLLFNPYIVLSYMEGTIKACEMNEEVG